MLVSNVGNVGIGLGNLVPASKLTVFDTSTTPESATLRAIKAGSSSGENAIPPAAIRGDATATSGSAAGVVGTSDAPDGPAVLGITSGNRAGSFESRKSSGQSVGVFAEVASRDGSAGQFSNSAGGALITGISADQFVFGVDGTGGAVFKGKVQVEGTLSVGTLNNGGPIMLCLDFSNNISNCSSSLRYKTEISSFKPGLEIINRLRPIAFTWKNGGMRDLGLGAEDVAMVEPLLVTLNSKGEIEGVKYDRVAVVLVNAIVEQQEQIKQQQSRIEQQQGQIESLRKLVCLDHPKAEVCK